MAKLEIFNSNAKVAESTTPRTSTLALPLSLATQRGNAISSVAKSIAAIQKICMPLKIPIIIIKQYQLYL